MNNSESKSNHRQFSFGKTQTLVLHPSHSSIKNKMLSRHTYLSGTLCYSEKKLVVAITFYYGDVFDDFFVQYI
jgi:hypothetical protein